MVSVAFQLRQVSEAAVTVLEAARQYRALNLAVIPVGKDKHPLIEWKRYQDELPHPDQVDEWWFKFPAANVGTVTGKISGLVVLDADGPSGLASLKALGTPATTWVSRTGRPEGGWQQFFKHPGNGTTIGNRAGLRPGLDVRGDGGYVILPPSLHASGRRYEWLVPPQQSELAPLSDALLKLLLAPEPPAGPLVGDVIPEGRRDDTLYRLGRSLAARGLTPQSIEAALLEENRHRCRPPLADTHVREIARHVATQPHRPDFLMPPPALTEVPTWPLYDAADAWTFAPVAFTVDELLPASGVIWWGGPPKRFKSLLCLYTCLAIASARERVADHFPIRQRPRILYIAREDGGSRLQGRRDDILPAWPTRPTAGAIRFLIRPRFDLLNSAHVAWLRDLCLQDMITLLVLDTWTALSPGADPMAPVDQATLAAVVVDLAEAIHGAVVVVDHSRKNRAEGQALSAADIYGPLQKWAAAEHIVMMDLTSDRRRLELFIEGKDGETRRCFLSVTPKGQPGEKFTYSGTIEEIAGLQREKGQQNRDTVHRTLCAAGSAQRPAEVHAALTAREVTLALDTVASHLRALAKDGRASQIGKGSATKYLGIPDVCAPSPSADITTRDSELFDGARG
jgi:hypothetical protein